MIRNYINNGANAAPKGWPVIGAYMSLLVFDGTEFAGKCLLVSPVVDMENIILGMMKKYGISDESLYKEGEIPVSSGQILSRRYLCYARVDPVKAFFSDTSRL